MDIDYKLKEIEIELDSRVCSQRDDALRRLRIILKSIQPSASADVQKKIDEFLKSANGDSLDMAHEMCYTALDAVENKKNKQDDDFIIDI